MRQRELGLGRGTHLMPGAAEVQKRGAAESELEFSALPTLALSDFSLHQSGTGQGLAARVPRGP